METEGSETKLLEVRDRATFVPVIVIKPKPYNEEERYLLARAGYGRSASDHKRYVLMSRLAGHSELVYDPDAWGNRTMIVAHTYIRDNWDSISNGQVIDVEYILGESSSVKLSERLTARYGDV
jgi:hypothetical protein